MNFSAIFIQRRAIVGWVAVAISLMVGAILLANGFGETGLRIAIRLTARSSCLLFLLAFMGSTLAALWPSMWTQWLHANRRYFGLSLAISHTWHAIAILALVALSQDITLAYSPGGLLGYVFLGLMTATSSDRAVRWLGQGRWHILHTVGAYYLWLAFLVSFSKKWAIAPIYAFMTGLLLLAMGLRIGNWIHRRAFPSTKDLG